jgi:signal transduction histidine kinase
MELEQTHAPAADPTSDLTLPCLIHDLNNVFQTLVEAADLLSADPRWASLSGLILRCVERGNAITSNLHTVDQAAAPFDSILDNAIAFVEDSLVARRGPAIRFVRDVDAAIHLQRTWAWDRVLINLFSNAVYAMPNGGTIYVQARRAVTEHGDQIEIVIGDDGPGIAPEILDTLFKPYVSSKARGLDRRGVDRRGLGLHIVQTIVKQEDGEVRVANPPGRGAEFTITIPSARPAHA